MWTTMGGWARLGVIYALLAAVLCGVLAAQATHHRMQERHRRVQVDPVKVTAGSPGLLDELGRAALSRLAAEQRGGGRTALLLFLEYWSACLAAGLALSAAGFWMVRGLRSSRPA